MSATAASDRYGVEYTRTPEQLPAGLAPFEAAIRATNGSDMN